VCFVCYDCAASTVGEPEYVHGAWLIDADSQNSKSVTNLSYCHFVHYNSMWACLGLNTDPRGERP